ncbi:MAG: septum formation initiator family protein [Myxococcota bacterium]
MRRRTLWLIGLSLLAGAALVGSTLWQEQGWTRRVRANTALETVEGKNREARGRVEHLGNEVRALRERPQAQERAVRQELGYIKPGDVVLDMGPEKTPPR